MTSTISEPVRLRDRRRQLRIAEVRTTESDLPPIPAPSIPLLSRPRVTERIGQATAQHRVTLVSGPAGAGKTVACAAWAASAGPGVGWLSLEPGLRPDRLWEQVAAVLAGTGAVPGEHALPDAGDGAFPARLAAAARRLRAPVTLVIDDIGEAAGQAALAGVDQLIRHAPENLRLVLAARHPAGLQLARLRVGGDLAEIGAADLACTPAETDAYFRMLGRELTAAQRDELLRRTQGWITGLRLAALRAAPGRPAALVARVAGDEPAVADYLWDEVLAGLPADSREFLLRTSVADVICGDLADALTGGNTGAALLERLGRANMMISDAGDAMYRFHPLLLEMLRARLERELPGENARLTRRAARWLAGRGLYVPAIRTAARAADWDFAARVLADAGPAMLIPGPAAELEPVLATFPAARYADDSAVAGALAAAGLRTGDICSASLHLDNAGQALERCAPAQRDRIATWLHALRLMSAADPAGDLTAAGRVIASEAERTVSGAGRPGVGLLWCALGVAELAGADAVAARASFVGARRQLRDGEPAFGERARAWQAVAEAVYGDLRAARDLLADPAADPLAGRLERLAAAYVHLARDEPAAARAALDECESGGSAPGADPLTARAIVRLACAARARAALADGDAAAARAPVSRLRYQSLNEGAAVDRMLAPLEAEIALRDGDQPRARQALAHPAAGSTRPASTGPASTGPAGTGPASTGPASTGLASTGPASTGPASTGLASTGLATARLLLAQGDNAEALGALAPSLDPAGPATLADRVGALVVAAVAARRLGQAERAAAHLTLALALAEPHEMYRPFLDGGQAARSALTALIRPLSEGAAFAARIQQRFEAGSAAPAGPAPACVPLTSSELAVLRFLPSHMTNQEIADALFLSINTVKTHLRSVYRKLGVTARRQAITRGGKLGLL